MTPRKNFITRVLIAGAFASAVVGLDVNFKSPSFKSLRVGVPEAHAIIGRPLTPLSYAGVARRTTRRAIAAGAYAAGAAAGSTVVVAPSASCVQAVDVYGRLYWRCP